MTESTPSTSWLEATFIWMSDVIAVPLTLLAQGALWWFMRDHIDMTVGGLVGAVVVTFLVTTPLFMAVRALVRRATGRATLSKGSLTACDLVARVPASAAGFMVGAGRGPLQAAIGAGSGLLVGAVIAAWQHSGEDVSDEELAERTREFQRVLDSER